MFRIPLQNPTRKYVAYTLIGIVVLLFLYNFLVSAPRGFVVGKIFTVEEGTSLRGLASKLKKDKLIRSTAVFESSIIILGGERHIIPADYLLDSRLSAFELAKRIAKGERHLAPVKVTVPEGFNIKEIAELMSAKLSRFNKEKFMELTSGKEGYLFPDTYFFFTNDTEVRAVELLENNFNKKISSLKEDIEASGRTEKEIIIMASIIEAEAHGDSDRGMISGILWKRLKIGMPLQADAAPVTYERRGLPDNPINNPGILSIRAAIYPESSAYLYYIHDKEGNIHYAKTFTEHRNNINKYLK